MTATAGQNLTYCSNTFIHWHIFSWFLQNALITGNDQWDNSISFDFYFRGLNEPRNQRKLEPPQLIMISQ